MDNLLDKWFILAIRTIGDMDVIERDAVLELMRLWKERRGEVRTLWSMFMSKNTY